MIPSQRAEFDIPEDVAYFNYAYVGPLSRRVAAPGQTVVCQQDQFPSNVYAWTDLAARRGGQVLDLGAVDAKSLLEACGAANVHVSVRGNAARITPHLYNTDADADRLVDALAAAASP